MERRTKGSRWRYSRAMKWAIVCGCVAAGAFVACAGSAPRGATMAPMRPLAATRRAPCNGPPLRVHFYNVAQALSALVDLPDGRHILVDTADGAERAGCGEPCSSAHAHLMSSLAADLGQSPIDML